MEIKINNKPTWADNYEFIVAKKYNGEYWFWEACSNGFRAEQAATEIDGVIFHNVRIQGVKK